MASRYKKQLDNMIWSFSRVSTFLKCPYKFYLIYIEECEKKSKFHAEYGKFIHYILEQYFKREFTEQDCLNYYIEHFDEEVTAYIRESTREKLFMAGIEYFTNLEWEDDDYEILKVEGKISFNIDKFEFVGYIDVLLRHKKTGEIILRDHKTGESPIGKKGFVLKAKQEEYENHKRQLYLYSIPVFNEYGVYPKFLEWNYPRSLTKHRIEFKEEELEETKKWVIDNIIKIYKEKKYEPIISYLNCHMLCDVCDFCEYNQIQSEEE